MKRFFDLVEKANELRRSKQFDDELKVWDEAIALFPFEPSAHLGAIAACSRSRNNGRLTALVDDAVARFPTHPYVLAEHAGVASDFDDMRNRLSRISGIVQTPSYFTTIFKLWFFEVQHGSHESALNYFHILLQEPQDLNETLPLFLNQVLWKLENRDHARFEFLKSWVVGYIMKLTELPPMAELAVLAFDIPHPNTNRAVLVYKWSMDHSIERLQAIYAVEQNKVLLRALTELLISNNGVGSLDEYQLYNYVLFNTILHPELAQRLLNAAFDGKKLEPVPLSRPLGVVQNIYRQSPPNPAPAIIAPSRLKIAVLISGQLRGFREAARTWRQFGFDGHDVDTFVHTWQRIGRRIPTIAHADRCFQGHFLDAIREVMRSTDTNGLRQRYPSLYAYYWEGGDEVTEQELRDLYGARDIVIQNDALDPFAPMNSVQKMHFKAEACYERSKGTGVDYDLILRIRPDLSIDKADIDWGRVMCLSRQERVLFTSDSYLLGWQGYGITDIFAVGVREVMEPYSTGHSFTYRAFQEKMYNFPPAFVGHLNVGLTAFMNNVRVRPLDGMTVGPFLDPDFLPITALRQMLLVDMGGAPRDAFDQLLLQACEHDIAITKVVL